MNRITFNVGGMTCMGCVNGIKRVLSALPGVRTVDVELQQGKVDIEFDSAQVQETGLKTAIEDAGYTVS